MPALVAVPTGDFSPVPRDRLSALPGWVRGIFDETPHVLHLGLCSGCGGNDMPTFIARLCGRHHNLEETPYRWANLASHLRHRGDGACSSAPGWKRSCKYSGARLTLIALAEICRFENVIADEAVNTADQQNNQYWMVQQIFICWLAQKIDPENSKRRTRHDNHLLVIAAVKGS